MGEEVHLPFQLNTVYIGDESGSDLKTRLESLKRNLDLSETILGSIVALEMLVFFFRGLSLASKKGCIRVGVASSLPDGVVSSFPSLT